MNEMKTTHKRSAVPYVDRMILSDCENVRLIVLAMKLVSIKM